MTAGQHKLVVAHRGAHRGAHSGAPGPTPNTIDAFEAAIRLGADMIEFDVRRRPDGELVVFHDEIVGPLGRQVPLLVEALDALKGRILLDLELKEAGDEQRVLDALFSRGYRLDDFVITAFDAAVVEHVKHVRPDVRTGLLVCDVAPATAFERFAASRADFLGPDVQIVDEAMLRDAAGQRIELLPWTVNEPRDILRLLASPAVRGVITDHTAEALRIRETLPS